MDRSNVDTRNYHWCDTEIQKCTCHQKEYTTLTLASMLNNDATVSESRHIQNTAKSKTERGKVMWNDDRSMSRWCSPVPVTTRFPSVARAVGIGVGETVARIKYKCAKDEYKYAVCEKYLYFVINKACWSILNFVLFNPLNILISCIFLYTMCTFCIFVDLKFPTSE